MVSEVCSSDFWHSGELYAQAFVREDHPLPVEAVIDSSR